jgi:hypothetical protein
MRTAFDGPELNAPPIAAASAEIAEPGRRGATLLRPLMRAVEIKDADALAERRTDWDDLCRNAIEANVFYESWMLLPAIEAFGEESDLRFVLIYAEDRNERGVAPLLCGLFPLERKLRYKGLPLDTLSLWRHLHCFLCTPPIRAGFERDCLAAFFDWLANAPGGPALMEFDWINTDEIGRAHV